MIEPVPETPLAPQQQSGPLPPFSGRPVPPKPREPLGCGRWFAVGVTAAFAVALVLLAVFVPRVHRSRAAKLSAQAQALAAAAARVYDTAAYAVKPNEVMTTLLSRAGFSTRDIGRIVPALRAAGFGFRAMRPGDSLFVLRRLGTGSETTRDTTPNVGHLGHVPASVMSPPQRLLYRRSVGNIYLVDIDSADVRVSMLLKYITRSAAFVKGTITSSLYETMMAMGEAPQLIMDYTDIFGWEIDFFSEVQPNDSFSILFERKYCDSACIGYGRILAATYSGQAGSFAGYRFTDPESTTDYYNAEGQNLRKTFQKSPLRFSRVSSFFGRRFHPILRRVRQHTRELTTLHPRARRSKRSLMAASSPPDGPEATEGWSSSAMPKATRPGTATCPDSQKESGQVLRSTRDRSSATSAPPGWRPARICTTRCASSALA